LTQIAVDHLNAGVQEIGGFRRSGTAADEPAHGVASPLQQERNLLSDRARCSGDEYHHDHLPGGALYHEDER
jgi:hypothetical protein